jgi:CHRD domain
MKKTKYLTAMISLSFVVSTCASIAYAETVKLHADMKGSNEVPPNTSPGSGTADATFDTDTKLLTWTVTYSNLTGPVMGAHFHGPVEAGKNAGIVLPFKTVESPIQGSATLTDNQATDLLAGKWYANIHTSANPGGELRGQMMK